MPKSTTQPGMFFKHNNQYDADIESLEKQETFGDAPFRDAVFLGLAVAIRKGLKPLEIPKGHVGQSIRKSVFKHEHEFLIKLAAFSATRDVEVLGNPTRAWELAEQLANAGMAELFKREDLPAKARPISSLVELLDLPNHSSKVETVGPSVGIQPSRERLRKSTQRQRH